MASVEDSDWRGEMTLLERQKFMYTGKYACDVTFIVGEKSEKVYAHQYILISGSVVFEQKLRTLNEREKQEIRVEGFTMETFDRVIKYLYCEEIELTEGNVTDILAAAEHYHIAPLSKKCFEFLQKGITVDNVLTILNKSLEHKTTSITEKCMQIIYADARQILLSEKATALSKDAVKLILEQSEFEDVTEVELFDFAIKWATDKCTKEGRSTSNEDIREALGDIIYCIRFASITTNEFTKVMKKCKVLSASERGEMYEYIDDDEKVADTRPPAGFTSKPCRPVRRASQKVADRLTRIGTKLKHASDQKEYGTLKFVSRFKSNRIWLNGVDAANAIDVLVDNNVQIHGVGLYGCTEPSACQVQVKLCNVNERVLADTGCLTLNCDGSKTPHRVMFPKSIPIKKANWFTILAFINGPSTHGGKEGYVAVTTDGCTFTFKTSSLDQLSNKYSTGQIPEILFSRI